MLSSNIDRFLQIMARNFTILIKRFRDSVRTYAYYHNLTISSSFNVRRDPSNLLPTALQVCVYLVDFWPLEFTVFLKRSFWPEVDALKIQYTKSFFIKILITEYFILLFAEKMNFLLHSSPRRLAGEKKATAIIIK